LTFLDGCPCRKSKPTLIAENQRLGAGQSGYLQDEKQRLAGDLANDNVAKILTIAAKKALDPSFRWIRFAWRCGGDS
jgi:hypothetical protein